MNIVLLIIAILPVYLIGLYVYQKDNEKEPDKLLLRLFIFGMLSCVPALLLEILLGYFFGEEEAMNLWQLFIYITIGIAFAEEICKWFVIYKLTYNNKEYDHIYDSVVYCIFTALGFAVVENILYVYVSGIGIGLFRAITAIPGHAAYAVIMATFYGRAKQAKIKYNKRQEKIKLALSIIVPTLVHSIYDYLIMADLYILLLVFIIFIAIIFKYSYDKVKKLSKVEENML